MRRSNGFGILAVLFFALIALPASAQKDRKDLEAQRKALEQQIKSTTEILNRTQKDKTRSLNQLKTLQAQIRQRQELLNGINDELVQLDRESERQEKQRREAESAIRQWDGRLKHALRTAYVRSQLHPDWVYVLSAESLGAGIARWVYLRQYKEYVRRQWTALQRQKEKHQAILLEILENKKSKEEVFESEQRNKSVIEQEQKTKEELVRNLGKEEKKLKSQLAATEEKKRKLDAEIARLISEESKKMTSSGLVAAPETKALNEQFSANQGKLPWPVGKGVITDKFGEHPHPVLKGIMIQNNGIDIQAEAKAPVKSLFEGTVASVQRIPGYDYMIMVRHGVYFSVYSKVASAQVKKGDRVTTGQVIGYLGDEEPELHLEIWKDKTKLNPEKWIAKR